MLCRWVKVFNVVSVESLGVVNPLDFIGDIMLIMAPGVIAVGVWVDVRMGILNFVNSFSSFLEKNSNWGWDSSPSINQMMLSGWVKVLDVVSVKSFGMIDPLDFVSDIMLCFTPSMITMGIRVDVRMRILDFVNFSLSVLSETFWQNSRLYEIVSWAISSISNFVAFVMLFVRPGISSLIPDNEVGLDWVWFV
jgi:hypothetical protein